MLAVVALRSLPAELCSASVRDEVPTLIEEMEGVAVAGVGAGATGALGVWSIRVSAAADGDPGGTLTLGEAGAAPTVDTTQAGRSICPAT